MIKEDQIDLIVEKLSQEPMVFETHLQEWIEWQPMIAAYVFSDTFSLLNEDEKEAFVFGSTVILTIAKEDPSIEGKVSEDDIGDQEEQNYETYESQKAKDIRSRMDPFFEDYPEEDLLAFIEDLCVDEEEEFFTEDGMKVMVLGMKTIVDVLFVA